MYSHGHLYSQLFVWDHGDMHKLSRNQPEQEIKAVIRQILIKGIEQRPDLIKIKKSDGIFRVRSCMRIRVNATIGALYDLRSQCILRTVAHIYLRSQTSAKFAQKYSPVDEQGRLNQKLRSGVIKICVRTNNFQFCNSTEGIWEYRCPPLYHGL